MLKLKTFFPSIKFIKFQYKKCLVADEQSMSGMIITRYAGKLMPSFVNIYLKEDLFLPCQIDCSGEDINDLTAFKTKPKIRLYNSVNTN